MLHFNLRHIARSILIPCALLCSALSLHARVFEAGERLYFNGEPNNTKWWKNHTDNPSDPEYTRLWAYFYNGGSHKWLVAQPYGSTNFYVEETETNDWTHVILTRHRGWVNSPEFDDNCLNRTGDISFGSNTGNYIQYFAPNKADASWWVIAPSPSGDPSGWEYEDEEICTSAAGKSYILTPKNQNYDNSKNHAWFMYADGSWTRLDGNEFRDNEGDQDYEATLGGEGSDVFYFLQAGKPTACRLIRIRLNQNCEPGAPGACKITSFIAVASDANVTDSTCAVDGLVAFDDKLNAGDLMVWCENVDTVTFANSEIETPQTFKLKGFDAKSTTTYKLYTKFLNGNSECEDVCYVTVSPPTVPVVKHKKDTCFTKEEITLTPSNQTSSYFQWTTSINDDKYDDVRNCTFPGQDEEMLVEYVFLATNEPPAPEGNLISNGSFENPDKDADLESDYDFWGRDNSEYYSSHGGASGGYAITDNAQTFWHDFQDVSAHEGSYFGLFDSKIWEDGDDQAAWIARSGSKNPHLKVQAGVSYLFSFWVANINTYHQMNNGARLQFQISYDGGASWTNLGAEINLRNFKDHNWHGRSSIATPNETSENVVIRVINLNQSALNIGNDFALDDIRFEAVTSHSANIAAYERFPVQYLECKITGATFTQPLSCKSEKADVHYTIEFLHPRGDLYIYEGANLLAHIPHSEVGNETTSYTGVLKDQPVDKKVHELTVYFEDALVKTEAPELYSYESHAVPDLSIESLTWGEVKCDVPTVTLTAVVNYTNQNGNFSANADGIEADPAPTDLEETDEPKQITLTFPGLTADGKTGHTIHIDFDGPHGCSIDSVIEPPAPYMPQIISTVPKILPYKCGDEKYKVQITVNFANSQNHDLIITDEGDNEITLTSDEYSATEASYTFKMPWEYPVQEHTFKAYFKGAEQCKDEATHVCNYTAPAKPTISAVSSFEGMECDKTTYTLQLKLTYTNQKGSKFYASVDGGTAVEVDNPNPSAQTEKSDVTINVTGLLADGKEDHTYRIWTANTAEDCELSIPYKAPFAPVISNIKVEPQQMGCKETKYNVVVTFDVTNGQNSLVTVWGKADKHETFVAKEGENTVEFKDVEIDAADDYFDIWFESANNCGKKHHVEYKEPVTPHISVTQGPEVGDMGCNLTTYTVKFDLAYINQRGKLFAWIDDDVDHKKQFEYENESDTKKNIVTITFTGLTGDGLPHKINVEFDGENSCSLKDIPYDAPYRPVIKAINPKKPTPKYECGSDGFEVELFIDYANGLGRKIFIKEGIKELAQITTENDTVSHTTPSIVVKLDFDVAHNLNVFFEGFEEKCPNLVPIDAVAKPSLGTIHTKNIVKCDETTFDVEVTIEDFVNQDGDLTVIIDDQKETTTDFVANSADKQTKTLTVTGIKADGNITSHLLSVAFVGGSHGCANTPTALSDVPHMPKIGDINYELEKGECNTKLYNVTISVDFENPHGDLVVTDGSLLDKTIPESELTSSPAKFIFEGIESAGGTKEFKVYFTGADTCVHNISFTEPTRPVIKLITPDPQSPDCDETTFTLKGTVDFEFGAGDLIITDVESGKSQTISPAAWSISNEFTITGIPADGKTHTILARFDGDPSCPGIKQEYKAPYMPAITKVEAKVQEYACDAPNYQVLVTVEYSNSQDSDLIITDEAGHEKILKASDPEYSANKASWTFDMPWENPVADHTFKAYFKGAEQCKEEDPYDEPAEPSLGNINTKYITKCDKTTFDLVVEVKDFVNQDGDLTVSIDGKTAKITPPDFDENSSTPQTRTLKIEDLQADGDNTSHILSVAFVGGSHGCANNPAPLSGVPHMPAISVTQSFNPEFVIGEEQYHTTLTVNYSNAQGRAIKVKDGDTEIKSYTVSADAGTDDILFDFDIDGTNHSLKIYFDGREECAKTINVKSVIETQTICQGDKIPDWYGQKLTPTETDNVFVHKVEGGENNTFTILTVTVHEKDHTTLTPVKLCYGEKYLWLDGVEYDASQTLSFTDKNIHLCDSIITLELTILPQVIDGHEYHTIKQGESYPWNDGIYTIQDVYRFDTQTADGCDSTAWLHLTVTPKDIERITVQKEICEGDDPVNFYGNSYDATGIYELPLIPGQGSDPDTVYTLDLTVHEKDHTTLTPVKLCYGEKYLWLDGVEYDASQTLSFTDKNIHLCDSIITLELTILPQVIDGHEYHTIKQGESYPWNDGIYTIQDVYRFDTQTADGCDSTAWLHLTVTPKDIERITVQKEICEGDDPVNFYGNSYDATGIYELPLIPGQGSDPDTVYTLDLTVHEKDHTTLTPVKLCYGEKYLWLDGVEYDASQTLSFTDKNIHLCDSIITLELTILPQVIDGHEYHTIKQGESYPWNDGIYTIQDVYRFDTQTADGCDSTAWLHLTVTPKDIERITVQKEICEGDDPVNFYGNSYDATGIYELPLIPGQGSDPDTVYTLDLTVHEKDHTTLTPVKLCYGEKYLWLDGVEYDASQTLSFTDKNIHLCDSIITLELTILPQVIDGHEYHTIKQGESYPWNDGIYTIQDVYRFDTQTADGCDSTAWLHLTVTPKDIERITVQKEICEGDDPVNFYGNSYDATGIYELPLIPGQGSDPDTVYTLDLTVHEKDHTTLTPVKLCYGEKYLWLDGVEYDASQTLSFTDKNIHLCDSIITLELTILPQVIDGHEYHTIKQGESYPWNDGIYTIQDVYRFDTQTADGCDSTAWLHLTVTPKDIERITVQKEICEGDDPVNFYGNSYDATGIYELPLIPGQGSDPDTVYTLDLTVHEKDHTTLTPVKLCYGEKYLWLDGVEYDASQTLSFTDKNIHLCDSIITLELTILPQVIDGHEYHTIKQGESYPWNDGIYTIQDVYRFDTQTADGCDSTAWLHLTVTPKDIERITVQKEICEGDDPVNFYGNSYDATGIYELPLIPGQGSDPDTVYTLDLTVHEKDHTTLTPVKLCYGEKYLWLDGVEYDASQTLSFTDKNIHLCDSIITLELTILPQVIDGHEYHTIKQGESYPWNDGIYTIQDVYRFDTQTADGCDSTAWLHLTVTPKDIERITVQKEICEGDDPVNFYGNSYDATGIYELPLIPGQGSDPDTVYTLDLTVHEKDHTTLTPVKLCYGEKYLWLDGVEYDASQTLSFTDKNIHLCDSIITLELIILPQVIDGHEYHTIKQGESYPWNDGIYTIQDVYRFDTQTADGCDSTAWLHLTVTPKDIERITVQKEICEGDDPVNFYGNSYDATGIYELPLIPGQGTDPDTVYTLDLTVHEKDHTTLTPVKLCYGEKYLWLDGVEYDASQTLSFTDKNIHLCDSIITLELTILPQVIDGHEYHTIKQGESYPWNDGIYTIQDVYRFDTQTADGCDSTAWLHLTVTPKDIERITVQKEICEGDDPVNFYGNSYDATGIYELPLIPGQGTDPDTVYTLDLTVHEKDHTTLTPVKLCYGEKYLWLDGVEYDASQTLSFTDKNIHLCDSIITLELTILPQVIDGHEYHTIKEGESYPWNDGIYTIQDVYRFDTQTADGCDSTAWLHLTVTPKDIERITVQKEICEGDDPVNFYGNSYDATGIYELPLIPGQGTDPDTVYTLDLTVHEKDHTTLTPVKLCYGEKYLWLDGVEYDASQTLSFTDKNIHLCDSIITLELTILPQVIDGHEYHTIKQGESYPWNDGIYTIQDVYRFDTQTADGCDSTAWLHLTVTPKDIERITVQKEICEGDDPVNFYGNSYDATGIYELPLIPGQGTDPDTVYTLDLTVHEKDHTTLTPVKLCYGEKYLWLDGVEYDASQTLSFTDKNIHLCDSIITLELTILPQVIDGHEYHTIKQGESYPWNDGIYTIQDVYRFDTQTADGCDSTAWLHLTVIEKEKKYITVSKFTCQNYPVTFYGKTYYSSGTYVTDLIKGQGTDPDTIYTLNLTVYPTYNMPEEKDTIIEGETYTWNGNNYVAQNTYTQRLLTEHDCDSIVTLNLTVLPNVVENVSISIPDQCAGEGALEIIIQHTGHLTDARLRFSDAAIRAGFENGTYPIKDDIVTIPYNVKAGYFAVDVDLLFHSRLKYSASVPFTLLYPNTVLEQGWLDAIFVLTHDYNGGYDFTAFQWYKKGQILAGETGPYLYQPLEVGAEYSAMLTEVSGLQMMTCPIIIEDYTDITLYPTLVSRNGMLHVHVSQNARLSMFSHMGEKVNTYHLTHGETQIEAPRTQGIFMAEVVLESGQRKIIKIMVR